MLEEAAVELVGVEARGQLEPVIEAAVAGVDGEPEALERFAVARALRAVVLRDRRNF